MSKSKNIPHIGPPAPVMQHTQEEIPLGPKPTLVITLSVDRQNNVTTILQNAETEEDLRVLSEVLNAIAAQLTQARIDLIRNGHSAPSTAS